MESKLRSSSTRVRQCVRCGWIWIVLFPARPTLTASRHRVTPHRTGLAAAERATPRHGDERWDIQSSSDWQDSEEAFLYSKNATRTQRPLGSPIRTRSPRVCSLAPKPIRSVLATRCVYRLLQLLPDRFEAPVASVHFNSQGRHECAIQQTASWAALHTVR